MITGKNATSLGSPLFVKDRFGIPGEAIQVSIDANAWRLPNDTYVQGDFTMTMWANKISCSFNLGTYCNFSNTKKSLEFKEFYRVTMLIWHDHRNSVLIYKLDLFGIFGNNSARFTR
jgi:hypothetical protein